MVGKKAYRKEQNRDVRDGTSRNAFLNISVTKWQHKPPLDRSVDLKLSVR